MGLAYSYLPTSVSLPGLQGKILGFLLESLNSFIVL
jgi:hypothetical protein